MPDERAVQISARLRPSNYLRGKIGQLYGHEHVKNIEAAIDDMISVDALAGLMDEALSKTITTDGRLDFKSAAAFVLGRMKEHQR